MCVHDFNSKRNVQRREDRAAALFEMRRQGYEPQIGKRHYISGYEPQYCERCVVPPNGTCGSSSQSSSSCNGWWPVSRRGILLAMSHKNHRSPHQRTLSVQLVVMVVKRAFAVVGMFILMRTYTIFYQMKGTYVRTVNRTYLGYEPQDTNQCLIQGSLVRS